jgi:hypothetical protein
LVIKSQEFMEPWHHDIWAQSLKTASAFRKVDPQPSIAVMLKEFYPDAMSVRFENSGEVLLRMLTPDRSLRWLRIVTITVRLARRMAQISPGPEPI